MTLAFIYTQFARDLEIHLHHETRQSRVVILTTSSTRTYSYPLAAHPMFRTSVLAIVDLVTEAENVKQ